MDRELFKIGRHKLKKTQASFADLLGISLKAVQSYEQGWREIPIYIERKVYFLLSQSRELTPGATKNCWARNRCANKKECPVWEFNAGKFCWFFCGAECSDGDNKNLTKIMGNCRNCDIIKQLFE